MATAVWNERVLCQTVPMSTSSRGHTLQIRLETTIGCPPRSPQILISPRARLSICHGCRVPISSHRIAEPCGIMPRGPSVPWCGRAPLTTCVHWVAAGNVSPCKWRVAKRMGVSSRPSHHYDLGNRSFPSVPPRCRVVSFPVPWRAWCGTGPPRVR